MALHNRFRAGSSGSNRWSNISCNNDPVISSQITASVPTLGAARLSKPETTGIRTNGGCHISCNYHTTCPGLATHAFSAEQNRRQASLTFSINGVNCLLLEV